MKTLILLMLLPSVCFGLQFGIEQGQTISQFSEQKFYTPAKYSALTLRTEGQHYFELIDGEWYGQSDGWFSGLSFGLKSSGKCFAESSLGLSYVKTNSTQLDGNKQFLIAFGINCKYENLTIGYKIRHISNGDIKGPNHGMDFGVVGLLINF